MPAIMLVDQDQTRLQALVSSLKTNAVDIRPAADGASAWRLIQSQMPNLVICSAAPAVEDSLILCRRLKLSGHATPFVAYTPAEDEALRLLFLEGGADDFVTVDALTELLRSMSAEPAATTAATPQVQQQQMFFRLRTGELGNVLQFLGFSQRTGRLEISFDSKTKDKANIGLVRGEVVHAEYCGVDGLEAVALLLSRGDAEAYFFDDEQMPGSEITVGLSQLLIEATVLSDEIRDAQTAITDFELFVQPGTPPKPDAMDADMASLWALIDGNSTIKEMLAEAPFGELRCKRALKKLLDIQAAKTVTAADAGVTPRSRAESLFRRFCRHLDKLEDAAQQKVLLSHLATLARRDTSASEYLNVVMLNFPASLKIVHAACRCECGSQAFLVEGSEVECSRCGSKLIVRSSASYSLKVDSIAREQGG